MTPSARPYWIDTLPAEEWPEASRDLPGAARVAVVGGGIVGLACAAYLTVAGVDGVVLLERAELLGEASGANGGGLWPGEEAPGPGAFHDLGRRSLELLRDFAGRADRDLELRTNGVLKLPASEADAGMLREETRRRREAGLGVEWLDSSEVLRLEPALAPGRVFGGARYPEDAHVHPGKLGAAFAREAVRAGARLFPGTAVHGWEELDHRTRLFTDRGPLDTGHVVLATGPWSPEAADWLGITVPVTPVKGLLVATAPVPALVTHSVMAEVGIIQSAAGPVVSGGTMEEAGWDREPHAETRERVRRALEEWVPALRDVPLTHSWARFRPRTPDGLPLVGPCGRDGRHVVAAGHFRNGLLLSALTGRAVADLITRGETDLPVAALDPGRFGPRAGG